MEINALAAIQRLCDYRQARCAVFPSDHSLQWFIRRHRDSLIEAGALVMLTGQWHAVADRFDQFVLSAGQKAAKKRVSASC